MNNLTIIVDYEGERYRVKGCWDGWEYKPDLLDKLDNTTNIPTWIPQRSPVFEGFFRAFCLRKAREAVLELVNKHGREVAI